MIATTATLAELLEAYNPGSSVRTEESIEARDRLNKAGYRLARLVMTLSEALTTVMTLVEDDEDPPLGATLEATLAVQAALAAVEELRL